MPERFIQAFVLQLLAASCVWIGHSFPDMFTQYFQSAIPSKIPAKQSLNLSWTHSMVRCVFVILFIFLGSIVVQSQDAQLAQQYYENGEYEKASELYNKLFQQSGYNDYYFGKWMSSLLAMNDFKGCEEAVQKQIKRQPSEVQYYAIYGDILEQQNRKEEATEQYRKAINQLTAEEFRIIKLANTFSERQKYDLAIETYERGGKLLKNEKLFAYHLADLYRNKGEFPAMIRYYLLSLDGSPGRTVSVKTILQRYLPEENYPELQTQLLTLLQNAPEDNELVELLYWLYIQKKDYRNALRQVKALDLRNDENGVRIFQLAQIADNQSDYDAAIECYNYICTSKGVNNPFFIVSKKGALDCQRKKVTETATWTETDLQVLLNEYSAFFQENGLNKVTYPVALQWTNVLALYAGRLDTAITLLEQLKVAPGLNPSQEAEIKIQLGDYYLIKGEIWESTLLYSQIDKSLREEPLGHEARFRNARLAYFNGDFEWAQAQCEVLKSSTSKLIANDALDLSIFIMDNLGGDSVSIPLQMYADAELFVYQNKFPLALALLDTIAKTFPEDVLQDDILWLKGNIALKQRHYTDAATYFQIIIDKFKEEIRADNALFELAKLYETNLNNKEQAMKLYEQLFTEFSSSTFAVDARKRFRILRGDKLVPN